MKVRTLRPHSNRHGDSFTKKKGDVYDHGDPASDIGFGHVEILTEDVKPAEKNSRTATRKKGTVRSEPVQSGDESRDGDTA